MTASYQDPPKLANAYTSDAPLRALLGRLLPANVFQALEADLSNLGARVTSEIAELGDAAEASPPRHIAYAPWGRRADRVATSDAWRELKCIAAEEGIVARAYKREHGALSRIDQFARVYLMQRRIRPGRFVRHILPRLLALPACRSLDGQESR